MAKAKALPCNPRKSVLTASIAKCIANGERILNDAVQVEFQEPPGTKLMLSMIAQEEFAKAFLLLLVREDVLPWSPQLLRAMNDHACKQLIGVVIDYIDPEWETMEDLERIIRVDFELGHRLPPRVASAINILRHEKIGRWKSNTWDWCEPPEYEPSVLHIAEGKRDRVKQDALYVRLGRDGSIASTPTSVSKPRADDEFAKAGRYRWFVNSLVRDGAQDSVAYGKVREAFMVLFHGES